MLSLNQLGAVLADPELRSMLKRVVTRKLSSDLKTVQAHAELSKHLTQNRRRSESGETGDLREIVREHLEYYGTLVDLSLAFHQQLIDKLARANEAGRDPPVNGLTLAMTAPVGATVRAPFKISNNRSDPITVQCRASPFVSEDGTQLVASTMAFNPPGAEIAPGSEEVFEAIVPVSGDFQAGRLYLATLSADGFDAMSIVVRLKVEGARAKSTKAEPPPAAAPASPRAGKSRASRGNRAVKSGAAAPAGSAGGTRSGRPAKKKARKAAGSSATSRSKRGT